MRKTIPVEGSNMKSKLNARGQEVLDPRPMALPVGFERPESIQDLITRLVTNRQIQDDIASQEAETFEEADDFDIPGDDPISPHEETFDPQHLLTREQEVMSGTVRVPTAQEVQAAKDLLARHRKAAKAAEPPKTEPPKAPESGA